MKRITLAHLAPFALAAFGIPDAAMAQSSARQTGTGSSGVTLFGVADAVVGYGHGSTTHLSRLYSGGNSASRIGFRGIEDLGGGMAAGFWLESGFNVDDGTGVAGNTNNQPDGATTGNAISFSRRSTVSLIAPVGELRLGRDFTAPYRIRNDLDPFEANGVGTSQPQAGTITGVTSTRASNMLGYFLPGGLGGVFGEVQYYMGENDAHTPISDNGNGYSARIGWRNDRFAIAAALSETDYARTTTAGNIRASGIGGSYDFGVAKLMAGYFRDKVEQLVPVTATGYILGALVPVDVIQLKASYSSYGTDAPGDPRADKLALGAVYYFSRRSVAYATYARVRNTGGSTVALNGSTTAPDRSSWGYDLGLRHSF